MFWSRRQSNNTNKAASLSPNKNKQESHLASRNLININGIGGGGGLITQSDSLLQTLDPGNKRDLVNKTMINFNNNSQPQIEDASNLTTLTRQFNPPHTINIRPSKSIRS